MVVHTYISAYDNFVRAMKTMALLSSVAHSEDLYGYIWIWKTKQLCLHSDNDNSVNRVK